MKNPYLHLRQKLNRPLFVPFTVVGDPNKEKSVEVIKTLIDAGADALELGFPFSDPPADGHVIQAADKRALDSGMTIDDCFDILRRAGSSTCDADIAIPIGLLIYYNLVLQRGIEKFYEDCKEAEVASVLVADLPLEHAQQVCEAAKKNDVLTVFMVSELTSDGRLVDIVALTTGYIYLVSYVGITGVEDAVPEEKVSHQIDRIRKITDLPIMVGFGINAPDQVAAMKRAGADGVIVGSRIVKEIAEGGDVGVVCEELKEVF